MIVSGRYRDGRLLALLAEDERRLERAARAVRELAEVADRVARSAAPREAFTLAQLRLHEAQATVAGELPHCRRLLVVEPERAGGVAEEARLALAEISDLVLEAQIDRDVFTLGFRWARKRRREVDARLALREKREERPEPDAGRRAA